MTGDLSGQAVRAVYCQNNRLGREGRTFCCPSLDNDKIVFVKGKTKTR